MTTRPCRTVTDGIETVTVKAGLKPCVSEKRDARCFPRNSLTCSIKTGSVPADTTAAVAGFEALMIAATAKTKTQKYLFLIVSSLPEYSESDKQ
jgi:hypothetical protein